MSEKQKFLKQFDALTAMFPVQGDARAVIHNGLEFPTTRDEYWKYSRTSFLLEKTYARNTATVSEVEAFRNEFPDTLLMVFVNGEYAPALSDQELPAGLSMSSMRGTYGERKALMLHHLDQYSNSREHAFQAFNTAYFTDGAFVTVDDGAVIEKPVCILHISAGERQMSNVRNLVLLGRNASLKCITVYEGQQNSDDFTNVVTEMKLAEQARAELYILQNESATSSHISTTEIAQSRDSHCMVHTVTKNGKFVRNNLNFKVEGQGCESNMYGIYLTGDRQHVDNHTRVDHLVPECESNELYKGVMSGRSTAVFNGKIMVHRDAQKINAFQSNQNILLSDTAAIYTKPELEIYADDVKCSHGCTIGQLDEEALFYLRSRGLSKKAASNLLVQAFADDVTAKINIASLKESVEKYIHQKLEEGSDD